MVGRISAFRIGRWNKQAKMHEEASEKLSDKNVINKTVTKGKYPQEAINTGGKSNAYTAKRIYPFVRMKEKGATKELIEELMQLKSKEEAGKAAKYKGKILKLQAK